MIAGVVTRACVSSKQLTISSRPSNSSRTCRNWRSSTSSQTKSRASSGTRPFPSLSACTCVGTSSRSLRTSFPRTNLCSISTWEGIKSRILPAWSACTLSSRIARTSTSLGTRLRNSFPLSICWLPRYSSRTPRWRGSPKSPSLTKTSLRLSISLSTDGPRQRRRERKRRKKSARRPRLKPLLPVESDQVFIVHI